MATHGDAASGSDAVGAKRLVCPRCRALFRGAFARCPRDGATLAPAIGDPLLGEIFAGLLFLGGVASFVFLIGNGPCVSFLN